MTSPIIGPFRKTNHGTNMNKIPMLSSMSFLSLPMLVLAPICPSCWSSFTRSFTIKTKDIWIAGWYILLMVQKSQTTTWDVSNHANNGINWCFFHQEYHHLMCFLGLFELSLPVPSISILGWFSSRSATPMSRASSRAESGGFNVREDKDPSKSKWDLTNGPLSKVRSSY